MTLKTTTKKRRTINPQTKGYRDFFLRTLDGIRGATPRIAEPERADGNGYHRNPITRAMEDIEYSLLGGWFPEAGQKIRKFCADDEVRRVLLKKEAGPKLAQNIADLAMMREDKPALEATMPLVVLLLDQGQTDVVLTRMRNSRSSYAFKYAVVDILLKKKAPEALSQILADEKCPPSLLKYAQKRMETD